MYNNSETDYTASKGMVDALKSLIDAGTTFGNALLTSDPIADGTTALEFANLPYGYYFITTTTGSIVTIDSTKKTATVHDKNSVPSQDKKQSLTNDNYKDDRVDVNIGDTVYFQVEVDSGKGSDKAITLTDTMSTGLTFGGVDSVTVTVGDGTGSQPTKNTNYTVTAGQAGKDNWTFKVEFNADYVKTLADNTKIYVRYTATINDNAVVDNAVGNSNQSTLTYSNQTTTDTVYEATYDFNVKKVIKGTTTFLDGAGFKLYDAATNGNQIKVKADGTTGNYIVDESASASADTQIMVTKEAGVNVRGLKPGTYYLEETTTPDGYNTLSERKSVEVKAPESPATTVTAPTVTVENNKGTELPSTGGIGTTIFYVAGSILIIGAAALLISRRKRQA